MILELLQNTPGGLPRGRILQAVAAVTLTAACASTGGLTRNDVMARYDKIDQLNRSVIQASGENASLLAPDSFKEAQKHLREAVEHAQDAREAKAQQAADRGLAAVERVHQNIEKSEDVLSEVLETRERAIDAGAPALFADRFRETDGALRKQARRIAKGDVSAARSKMADLVKGYAELELAALKESRLDVAKRAVQQAKEHGADDYAPKTLERAEHELELLISVIEADRTQTEKANRQAERTVFLARRAAQISLLARRFEEQDLDHEGMILWHQRQLLHIREPLHDELPFDKPSSVVVNVLRRDVQGLMNSLSQMRTSQAYAQARIDRLEKDLEEQRTLHEQRLERAVADLRSGKEARIRELQEKLAQRESEEAKKERRRQAALQRFEDVKALFSDAEGQVLRSDDSVILRLHGFDFPPGTATIEARNYGLLNRIATALNVFPESKAMVTGHTDSIGGDGLNERLSLERAKNVEDFLEKTAGISAERVESAGRGESEPVAKNDTKEGRARNRRIEVVIQTTTDAPTSQ